MPVIAHALMVLTSLTSADIRLPGESDPVIQKNGTQEASYSLESSLREKPLIPIIEDFPTPAKLVSQRDPGGGPFPSYSSLFSTVGGDEEREPQVPFRNHVSWGYDDNMAAESSRLPHILPSPLTFTSEPIGEALNSPPPARKGVPDPSIPYDYSESTFNEVDPAAYAGLFLPYHSIRNISAFGNTSQSHYKTKPPMFGDRLVPKMKSKDQIKSIVSNSSTFQYEEDGARENYDRFHTKFEEYNDYYDDEDYDYNLPQHLRAPVTALFGTKEHGQSNQRLSILWDLDYPSAKTGPEEKSNLLRGSVPPESLDFDENVDLWPLGVVLSPPVSPHLESLRDRATSDFRSIPVDKNTLQFSQSLRTRANQSDTQPFSPVILPDFPQSHPSNTYPGTLVVSPYYIRPDRDIASSIDIPPTLSSGASSGTPKNSLSSPIPVPPFIQRDVSTSVSPHNPIEPSIFPPSISILFPSNTSPPPVVSNTSLPGITTSVSLSSDTAPSNLSAEPTVVNNSTSLVSFSDPLQIASLTEPSGGKDPHIEFISPTDTNSQTLPKGKLEDIKDFQHEGLTPQYSEPPKGIPSLDISLPSDFQLRENLASSDRFRNKERILIPTLTNFPYKNSSSDRGITPTSKGVLTSTPESSVDFTVTNVPATSENTFIFNKPTSSNLFVNPTVSTSTEDFFEPGFTSTLSTNQNESIESETSITLKRTVSNNDSIDPENIHSRGTGSKTFKGAVTNSDLKWGLLDGEKGDFAEYDNSVPSTLFDTLPGDTFEIPTNSSSDLSFTDVIDIFSVRPMNNYSGFSSNIPPEGFDNLFSVESSDSNSANNPAFSLVNVFPNVPPDTSTSSYDPFHLSLDSPPNLRFHDPVDITLIGSVNTSLLSSANTGHKNFFTVTETNFSNDYASFQSNLPTNVHFRDYASSAEPNISPSGTSKTPYSGPISNPFVGSSDSHFKGSIKIKPNSTTIIPISGSSLSLSNSSNGIFSTASFRIPFINTENFESADSVVTPAHLEPPGLANVPQIDPDNLRFTRPAYASSDGHANLSPTDPVIFQPLYPASNTPITHVNIHSNSFDEAAFTSAANSHSFISANSSANNLDKSFLSKTESSGFRDREKNESMHDFLHDGYVQTLTDSEFMSHSTLAPAENLSIPTAPDTLFLPRASRSHLLPSIPSTEIDAIADPRPTTPYIPFYQLTSPTPRETFVSPATFVNTLVLPTNFAPSHTITHSTTLPPPIPSQVSFTIPAAPYSHGLNEFLVILSNDTHSLILPQQKGEFSILLTGFKNRENTPLDLVDVKSPGILPIQAELQETNLDITNNGARQLELATRIEKLKDDEYSQRETKFPDKTHDHSNYHHSKASKVLPSNVVSPGSGKDRVSSLRAFNKPLVDSFDNRYPPPRISEKTWNNQQILYNSFDSSRILSNISSNNTSLFDLWKKDDATPNVEEAAQKKYEQFRFNDSFIDAIIRAIRRREQVVLEKDERSIRNANSEEKERLYMNEPVKPFTSALPSKFFIRSSVKNSREAVSTLGSFPTAESVPSVHPEPYWPEISKSNVLHVVKSDIVTGLRHGGTTSTDTSSFVPSSPALTSSPAREDENLSQTGKPDRLLKQTTSPSIFDQAVGAHGAPDQKKGIQGHSLYSFLFGQPRTAITRLSTEEPFVTDNQPRFSGDELGHWIWKGLPHRQRPRNVKEWIQVLREIRGSNLLNNTTLKKPLNLQGMSGVHNNANKSTQLQGVQDLQEGISGGGISETIIDKESVPDSSSSGLDDSADFIQTSTRSHSEERWIWRRKNPTS